MPNGPDVSVTDVYVTPITCPHCRAQAHLADLAPAIVDGRAGINRSFVCDGCGERTEVFIRDDE
jgi:hypothetical protein